MTLALQPSVAAERGSLTAKFAAYVQEVAPGAGIDPAARVERILNRPDQQLWWITADGSRIGFAIVLTLPEGQHELSEFTIFPPHRRHGLGSAAAQLVFHQFPGVWRLGLSESSPQAAGFWGTCLSTMPGLVNLREGAPFTGHQIKSYTFDIAGPEND